MNSETAPIKNTDGEQHVCANSGARGYCVLPMLVLPALIIALTVFAYHRTLFNFFAGDDYCHLAWLSAAAKNPSLTLNNFTGSWLGGVTTHFYRPLISLSLLFDYTCFGNNAAGWHIDNLIQLLVSSFFLYCIFDSISKLGTNTAVDDRIASLTGQGHALSECSNNERFTARLWAIAAAGLFALYPLHPEAVSWIVGRVDSLSTCFYLGSLCCYILWRTDKQRGFLILSLVSMVAGLLSKETVVTLPAAAVAFEITFGGAAVGQTINRLTKLLWAFQKTAPLWIVLVCYAAVRRLALGTFVGGYDVSLALGLSAFVQTWLHSLQMMLIPINHDFIGVHDWRAKLWGGFIILSAASLIAALITNSRARPQSAFLFNWLVLSLLPVWNIFSISSQLQGARFGYLPSAPLCGLLLMGYFFFNATGTRLLRLCVPCFLLLSSYMLYVNNEAWHADGVELSVIERSLANTLSAVPRDCQIMLLNLPDSVHGAYACRNAADGILFRIGDGNDSARCMAVSRCQGVFPTGFLKDSIAANTNKIAFLWWDRNAMKFTRIDPVADTCDKYSIGISQRRRTGGFLLRPDKRKKLACTPAQHSGHMLTTYANLTMQPVAAPGVTYKQLQSNGGLFVKSVKPGIRPRIDLPSLTGRNCWDIDFIAASVLLLPGGTAGGACGMDLVYANASNTRLGDLCYRAHANVANVSGVQKITFALRGDEGWTFGRKATGCALLLPDQCEMIVRDIQIIAAHQLIPRLAFAGGDYLHSKGFVGLNRQCAQKSLQYDATAIPGGASGVCVEISKRNATFESANASDEGNNIWKTFVVMKPKGTYDLKLNDFSAPGYYSLRIRAVDAAGSGIGPASDHIVVLVQK